MTPQSITGERVSTQVGGFNPTWQRHVAGYALCAPMLPAGLVLDLACGVGHSHHLLAPRESVGLDIDPEALAGQGRETRVADMRSLPFQDASFASVLAVHAIEHVPDPERVIDEADRVLEPDGVAVFVTPNRLTFGQPEEVIDPYHYVEFSPDELRSLCRVRFERVELVGLFGSPRYLELLAAEREDLERLLRLDPVGARRLLPRRLRKRLYDWGLRRRRAGSSPEASQIDLSDFELRPSGLDLALDLVAVCHVGQR